MPAIEFEDRCERRCVRAQSPAHARACREAARTRNPHARAIGASKAAVRPARTTAAARASRAPARYRRTVAGAVLHRRLRPRHTGPRQVRARRRHDRRRRLRVGRALPGGRERLRDRCRRDPAHGTREAAARPGVGAEEQAAVHSSGRIRWRQPAALPRRRLHPWRRDLPQSGEALRRRRSGHHRGARLIDSGRRLHAGLVRLRDHGARAGQGVSRRAAIVESRDRRDRDRRGARRGRHAYACIRARRISRRGRRGRRALRARGDRALELGQYNSAARQAATL